MAYKIIGKRIAVVNRDCVERGPRNDERKVSNESQAIC